MTPARAVLLALLAALALLGIALTATWLGYGWAGNNGYYRHLQPRPIGGWQTPTSPGPSP